MKTRLAAAVNGKTEESRKTLPVAFPQSHQHLLQGTDILEDRNTVIAYTYFNLFMCN